MYSRSQSVNRPRKVSIVGKRLALHNNSVGLQLHMLLDSTPGSPSLSVLTARAPNTPHILQRDTPVQAVYAAWDHFTFKASMNDHRFDFGQ